MTVTAGMLSFMQDDTIKSSLASIMDFVDEIVIVNGLVKTYYEVNYNYPGGHEAAITDLIRSYNSVVEAVDDLGLGDKVKIISGHIIPHIYESKAHIQNRILENITKDIYLKVDGDEVYKPEDLELILNIFNMDSELTVMAYRCWHFWKSLDQVVIGGQWDSPVTRVWRFKPSFRHPESSRIGFNMMYDTKEAKLIEMPWVRKYVTHIRLMYHLGYADRPTRAVQNKLRYYKHRNIEKHVEDTWTKWRDGEHASPTHDDPDNVILYPVELLPEVLQ